MRYIEQVLEEESRCTRDIPRRTKTAFLSENGNSSNNNRRIKLLIVDSPINHYRNEYAQRKELPNMQKNYIDL